MLPSESVERPHLEMAKAWRGSSWNASSANHAMSRLFRALSLRKLLRALSGRKNDRYFDTGESGETYDAEMEAAASMEI
jgi:hypothetical protein